MLAGKALVGFQYPEGLMLHAPSDLFAGLLALQSGVK